MASLVPENDDTKMTDVHDHAADTAHTAQRRQRSEDSASPSPSSSPSQSRSRSRHRSRSRSGSASSNVSYQTPREDWSFRPSELHYKPALILRGHRRGVSGVKFSPDGKRIASCSADATIKIWDADTGRLEHTLEGHMAGISCIAWSPDSTILASGSDDKVIRLWDVIKVCELRAYETRAVILTWHMRRAKHSQRPFWATTITSTHYNSHRKGTC